MNNLTDFPIEFFDEIEIFEEGKSTKGTSISEDLFHKRKNSAEFQAKTVSMNGRSVM